MRAIPYGSDDEQTSVLDLEARASVLHILAWFMVVTGVAAGITNASVKQFLVAAAFLLASALAAVALFLFRGPKRVRLSGNLIVGAIFLALSCANLLTGGFGLPAHFNMGMVPLAAFMLVGSRSGFVWALLGVLEIAAVTIMNVIGMEFPSPPPPEAALVLQSVGAVVPHLVLTGIGFLWLRMKLQTLRSLSLAVTEARAASEAKSSFLANVSHEIRTPMNGVLGMLQLLESEPVAPAQATSIRTARRSAEALLRLLDDVIDFSRVQARRLELRPVPTDLYAELDSMIALFVARAKEKRIALRLELDPKVPRGVLVDPTRLRQVVFNLLSNAIKFTATGEVVLSAQVAESDGETSRVEIAVRDTGEGIPADELESVFEVFQQVDGSATRRHGGAGLGLAISKHLVSLMGGALVVESEVGVGSRFSFLADLAHVEAPADTSNVERIVAPHAGSRVLVVDDDRVNRTVARRFLEAYDIEVEVAVDGIEALNRVQGETFDLVLMDCLMPRMDGWDTSRAIRELAGTTGGVPIVALTASALAGDEERCREAGMDDFLTKPLRRQALETVLARWLNRPATAPTADNEAPVA